MKKKWNRRTSKSNHDRVARKRVSLGEKREMDGQDPSRREADEKKRAYNSAYRAAHREEILVRQRERRREVRAGAHGDEIRKRDRERQRKSRARRNAQAACRCATLPDWPAVICFPCAALACRQCHEAFEKAGLKGEPTVSFLERREYVSVAGALRRRVPPGALCDGVHSAARN